MPEDHQDNSVVFIDTVLQYHLSLPAPDLLETWEWAEKYAILLELLKAERDA